MFQFTRAGGARLSPEAKAGEFGVSIHARGGRATGTTSGFPLHATFQFTRAGGARLSPSRIRTFLARFNSRARGARDAAARARERSSGSFNSRARGARDGDGGCIERVAIVSIHARGGRATGRDVGGGDGEMFQFTRAGGARPSLKPQKQLQGVSIHARGGRATLRRPRCHIRSTCFNSRARGARDRCGVGWRCRWGSFNSRARGARDYLRRHRRGGTPVSIHARGGRATVPARARRAN